MRAALAVRNVNRTVGTILGHEVTKRYGGAGLPDDTIDLTLTVDLPLPQVAARAVGRVMQGVMARMGDKFAENLLDHLR